MGKECFVPEGPWGSLSSYDGLAEGDLRFEDIDRRKELGVSKRGHGWVTSSSTVPLRTAHRSHNQRWVMDEIKLVAQKRPFVANQVGLRSLIKDWGTLKKHSSIGWSQESVIGGEMATPSSRQRAAMGQS